MGGHEDQVQQGGAQLGQARPGPADTPGTASLLTTLISSSQLKLALVISSSGVGSSVRGRLDNEESVLFACAVFCCKLDLIS